MLIIDSEWTFEVKFYLLSIQGRWANSDGANPDDRGNPDDFLGKNLKIFPTLFLYFFSSRPPKSSFKV